MKRLSRDQKRKAKKRKEARRIAQRSQWHVEAYRGRKYRTEELIRLHVVIEQGIHLADTILDKDLTDREVRRALESLVVGIRTGVLRQSCQPSRASKHEVTDHPTTVLNCIRSNLSSSFSEEEFPSWDNIAGVARSILGSIECHTTAWPNSRGYLEYLEGFLRQLGADWRPVSGDFPVDPMSMDAILRVGAVGVNVGLLNRLASGDVAFDDDDEDEWDDEEDDE